MSNDICDGIKRQPVCICVQGPARAVLQHKLNIADTRGARGSTLRYRIFCADLRNSKTREIAQIERAILHNSVREYAERERERFTGMMHGFSVRQSNLGYILEM